VAVADRGCEGLDSMDARECLAARHRSRENRGRRLFRGRSSGAVRGGDGESSGVRRQRWQRRACRPKWRPVSRTTP
jgi:hypothetical protein